MNKKIMIRKATQGDLKDIQRLNHSLFVKEYREYDRTLDTGFPYTTIGKEYFVERMTKPAQGIIAVAELGGKVIGYICGGLQKRKASRIKARYAELENMLVEPKFRGKSVGSQLIAYFFAWCENHKVDYVSVIASSKNFRAQKLYQKMGFRDLDVHFQKKM